MKIQMHDSEHVMSVARERLVFILSTTNGISRGHMLGNNNLKLPKVLDRFTDQPKCELFQ